MTAVLLFALGYLAALWVYESDYRSRQGEVIAESMMIVVCLPVLWTQRIARLYLVWVWKRRPDSYRRRRFFTGECYHATLWSIYAHAVRRLFGRPSKLGRGPLPAWYNAKDNQQATSQSD